MKNIIIGTAGHIDHGKQLLIRALTGRNTYRWEEEQRRGITIDLGFTYFDLPTGDRAGIIDVRGTRSLLITWLPVWWYGSGSFGHLQQMRELCRRQEKSHGYF